MNQQFTIRPTKIFRILLGIIAVLFLGHCLYGFTRFVYGYSYRQLFEVFNFNSEANFPTFYSVVAILFAALLLMIVGLIKKRKKIKGAFSWLSLSAIFVFLAYDEAAQVHEMFNKSIRPYLPEESYSFLYWAWVIPYFFFAVVVAFSFLKFLIRLPKKTSSKFIIAGVTFIIGAIGFELFNSYFFYNEGKNSFGLYVAFTLEEVLEMLGIAIFIYAILEYMKSYMGDVFVFGLNKSQNEDVKISDSYKQKHIVIENKEIVRNYNME